MGCYKMGVVVMAVMVVVVGVTRVAEGQPTPACAQKLVPCVDYLNSTSPPATCCTPLKEAVKQDRDCLCNLLNSPGLFESLHINITQALLLPQYCGVSNDASSCKVSAPSPTSSVPPGVPGGGDSGAGRIAWTGVSSFLLFWASMMLY